MYSKVKETISKWKDIAWTDVINEIQKMTETIEAFGRDCSKLPGVLKGWGAYKELKQEIDDMIEIIPLVEALAKPSIRPRHWDEIIEMTSKVWDYHDSKQQRLLESRESASAGLDTQTQN